MRLLADAISVPTLETNPTLILVCIALLAVVVVITWVIIKKKK